MSRTPEEFETYSLPGSINVPLSNLLSDEFSDILNQDAYTNVFYSNDQYMPFRYDDHQIARI